jgi:tetratricopeptide (TPR) repeat protein
MKIFVSYASEQAEIAQSVDLALRGEGHQTFFDRASLPGGEAYNRAIREGVQNCDLFVFLVSPESVRHGRYSLTELEFAQAKWPNPSGHVLPVMLAPTDMAAVPPYLKAVSILQPSGDIPASVAAEVARVGRPWYQRTHQLRWLAAAILMAAAAGSVWVTRGYLTERRHRADAQRLIGAAKVQQRTRNYDSAWSLAAEAATIAPRESEAALEELAMEWLRNIRVTEGKETFSDIVAKVSPVLSRCAASASPPRSADCLAHLGWADFLQSREGTGGLDPAQSYRRAIEIDPGNVFAHTMLGHYLATTGGRVDQIRAQFRAALASERERAFVRRYQFAAFLYHHDAKSEVEAVRVADDMRRNNETFPDEDPHEGERWRLWNVYYDRLINGHAQADFLSALPAADQLATFRWLFPDDVVPDEKRLLHQFMLATFQETNGNRVEALRTFGAVKDALAREGATGRLAQETAASLKRLSR